MYRSSESSPISAHSPRHSPAPFEPVKVRQIPIVVTVTPRSIGVEQENIQPQFNFPGTANQNHIVMSSNPDDFELDEEVERVKADFLRKMKAAMIKLKSIFRMYQIDKFSASILKDNREDWLKRVETHAEDVQELVVSFLDNVFITERDQTEADNLLDQFMISVSDYMLAYHTKIGSGVQTAGCSNSLSVSHESSSNSASGVNKAIKTAKMTVDNEAKKIPQYPQPRWFNVKQGDVIMFQKVANELSGDGTLGQIGSVVRSKDSVIRRVEVRYNHQHDKEHKFTDRAVRRLVRLFHMEHNNYIEVEKIIGNLESKAKLDEKSIDKVEPLSSTQYSYVNIKVKTKEIHFEGAQIRGKAYEALAVLMSETTVIELPADEDDDGALLVQPVPVGPHDEVLAVLTALVTQFDPA